jgi:hypothetical protein
MDRDRAKFVLGCFRSDGSDAGDRDFADALHFATLDRELGEWLVRERAFDAEFAESLARVDLPQGLRERVLLAMVQGAPDTPKVEFEHDKLMIGALSGVTIPEGLRGRVLEAMDRSNYERVMAEEGKKMDGWIRFGIPLAAAAGVALAFAQLGSGDKAAEVVVVDEVENEILHKVSLSAVQAGFVNAYESSVFRLEVHGEDKVKLVGHLRSKGLPCGGMKFPPGLEELDGLGCCELVVDGKRGSVICFNEETGIVHLIIFKRNDIDGELPGFENPNIEMEGEWAKASWANERYAYTLISNRDGGDPSRFF